MYFAFYYGWPHAYGFLYGQKCVGYCRWRGYFLMPCFFRGILYLKDFEHSATYFFCIVILIFCHGKVGLFMMYNSVLQDRFYE